MSAHRVSLIAFLRARESDAATVADALVEMAARVHEREPRCHAYRVQQSISDPCSFAIYEEYSDKDALAAHRASPHMREIIEGRVVPLLVERQRQEYIVLPPTDDSKEELR